MKKIALFLLTLFVISSCGRNKDDYQINYSGPKTIDIVLLEEMSLGATSDSQLTYFSDNEMVVTVTTDGVIKGKNVGEANVTVKNSENTLTLKVVVSLFEEPSFNFGISANELKNIYGEPNYNFGDSVLIYGSGNNWYSYAVWEMDFFLNDNQYIESDLYIRSDVNTRLNEFLHDNYFYYGYSIDTIDNVVDTCHVYLNDSNEEEATVLLGKLKEVGKYDDICLFYIPFEYEAKSDINGIVKNRNRRSK